MKMLRYVYVATFLLAVAIAFIVDLPMWAKLAVLTWTEVPALIHEYQLSKQASEPLLLRSGLITPRMLCRIGCCTLTKKVPRQQPLAGKGNVLWDS